MKILTVKNALRAAAILPLLSSASFALSINDPGVVGTVKDGSPAGAQHEVVYLQNLLDQGPGLSDVSITDPNPIGEHFYSTSTTDYNATLDFDKNDSNTFKEGTGTTVDAGWDFVIAKYGNGNNGNGGDVAFYLGGAGGTIPGGWPFGDNENGLSGWTVFNATDDVVVIPPEGTLPDGGATMLLLGGGISTLALLRRKVS